MLMLRIPKMLFSCAILIFILFLTPSITFGQSAKDAIMALKKLEARVEIGISYKDYGPALGETKFPVNLFLESSEAKEKPELAIHIENAIQYFEIANFIWEYKFPRGRVRHFIPKDDGYGKHILKSSQISKFINHGMVYIFLMH